MKALAILALHLLAGSAALAQTAWPPLPKDGFIVGRAATRADIAAGRAVFVAESNGVALGKPLPLKIPQYAWLREDGKKVPVIVLQAETAAGQSLVGALRANGTALVATLPEFELLGQQTPK